MKQQSKIKLLALVIIVLSVFIFFFLKHVKENKLNQESSNYNFITNEKGESMEQQKIKLFINNHELIATLNDNSSSRALIEELKKGSITINMKDYANMEKVGDLGFKLPQNNEDITTSPGDLILYQGNQFVIYYDTNNWSLTRLGKIDSINEKELKTILGRGKITAKISLN